MGDDTVAFNFFDESKNLRIILSNTIHILVFIARRLRLPALAAKATIGIAAQGAQGKKVVTVQGRKTSRGGETKDLTD